MPSTGDELEVLEAPAEGGSRATGSAGLGLAGVRAVVRRHCGEIVLANRPEGGLRQTALLPLA